MSTTRRTVQACVEMGMLWEEKNVIQQLDVITQHVIAVQDGEGMGLGIVMRCVGMGWLLVENNVTALLSAVTDIAFVFKTTHTTMRQDYAHIVGMGYWNTKKNATRMIFIVIIQHVNVRQGIHPRRYQG